MSHCNMKWKTALAGAAAGAVSALFGAGGGLVFVRLAGRWKLAEENEIFPASLAVMFPVTLITLLLSADTAAFTLPLTAACLIGAAAGGIAAGILGQRIAPAGIHRILGAIVILGGILCLR